ncbi:Uncharacterised protein [Mycobacteroides abscessus subsp. abscessus]|nr:Uncharacterised protein [Mycobacteroides abscessus subsp. abscessus]
MKPFWLILIAAPRPENPAPTMATSTLCVVMLMTLGAY